MKSREKGREITLEEIELGKGKYLCKVNWFGDPRRAVQAADIARRNVVWIGEKSVSPNQCLCQYEIQTYDTEMRKIKKKLLVLARKLAPGLL